MAEIAAIPLGGMVAASLFSGCGGSCLGWRMAGFRNGFASDCDPAARASHELNFPGVQLDPRDVRFVQPDDILRACNVPKGGLDALEGSPPCTAFSTAGKRQKGWGKEKSHAGIRQSTEDLSMEFVRLVRGTMPRVFAMENVKGMAMGAAVGKFRRTCAALRACGYRVAARILDAQWLGVPQHRERLFVVGVREDLGLDPVFPDPLQNRVSLAEAIGSLQDVDDTAFVDDGYGPAEPIPSPSPSPTVRAGRAAALKMIQVVGNKSFSPIIGGADRPATTIMASGASGRVGSGDISGFAIGAEAARLKPGEQSERYFSLVRPEPSEPSEPSPTVTALGGSPGTAAVLHQSGLRKFTIAELRRVCSFPDDFALAGSYAQQWARLGNAVPPLMARAVAVELRDRVLLLARTTEKQA